MPRGAWMRVDDDTLALVYGAALAASGAPRAAEHVVLVLARRDSGAEDARVTSRLLVERALLAAVRDSRHPMFAAMLPEDREAVVLARLAGYSVAEIAAALGIAPADVPGHLRRGLKAALHQRAARVSAR